MTWLYIPSFIDIRSGVSEHQGVKIWPFPLLWLVVFTTACTTVQAVISRDHTLARLCESVVRTTIKVNGKGQNLTPRHP